MSDARIDSFQREADKILNFLQGEYAKLQTGRANAALIEHVNIEAYGQNQPLKSLASIMISDARTIVVQPWDKSVLQNIDKALQQAELGTSPTNDGSVIRISLPPMTQERRQQLVKIVHQLAEEARISVRQQRGSVHDKIKADEKDEDVRYTLIEQLEKSVKTTNEKIDETKEAKEKEVMTV